MPMSWNTHNAAENIAQNMPKHVIVHRAAMKYDFKKESTGLDTHSIPRKKSTHKIEVIMHATFPKQWNMITGGITSKLVITQHIIIIATTLIKLMNFSIFFRFFVRLLFLFSHILYNKYTKCQILKTQNCK